MAKNEEIIGSTIPNSTNGALDFPVKRSYIYTDETSGSRITKSYFLPVIYFEVDDWSVNSIGITKKVSSNTKRKKKQIFLENHTVISRIQNNLTYKRLRTPKLLLKKYVKRCLTK